MRRQRTRWTRGLIESLITHRKMFMNRKYGRLGVLGYPYWVFLEWLSPLVAFGGIVYTIFLIITNSLNWPFYLLLYTFVYTFAISLTIWAVLFEEITFHKYKKKRDVLKLIATAFLEPFFYPVHTYFAVRGNIEVVRGKKGWGKAARSGFEGKATVKSVKTRFSTTKNSE